MTARALTRTFVDQAVIYGPDDSTGRYDVPLLDPFDCLLAPKGLGVLGTNVGGEATYYVHCTYPAEVTLPGGYWELVSNGTRYTRRMNSDSMFRKRDGTVLGKTIDLDALGPVTTPEEAL